MRVVTSRREALRLGGGSGFRLRCLLRGRSILRRLLLLLLLLLLVPSPAPAPPPSRAARLRLRRRQVVRERVRDLLHRAQPLAGGVDELVRARRVALGGGEQCGADLALLVEGGVHELGCVLLVPVTARVRERSEQPFRLRELAARA